MEHGNYGNCIRQVLGGSSPQKHLKRREEYVSGLNGLLSSSDEVLIFSYPRPMMQSVGCFHALCLISAAAQQSEALHLKAKHKGKHRERVCELNRNVILGQPHPTHHPHPPSAPLQ